MITKLMTLVIASYPLVSCNKERPSAPSARPSSDTRHTPPRDTFPVAPNAGGPESSGTRSDYKPTTGAGGIEETKPK